MLFYNFYKNQLYPIVFYRDYLDSPIFFYLSNLLREIINFSTMEIENQQLCKTKAPSTLDNDLLY